MVHYPFRHAADLSAFRYHAPMRKSQRVFRSTSWYRSLFPNTRWVRFFLDACLDRGHLYWFDSCEKDHQDGYGEVVRTIATSRYTSQLDSGIRSSSYGR
nr:hypothetical protein CFP56_11484 [Quercus suber]